MATTLPPRSSDHSFSISKFISRIRTRTSTRKPKSQHTHSQTVQDKRQALIPAPLPLVLPEHQYNLPILGWTTITFPQPSQPQDTTDLPTRTSSSADSGVQYEFSSIPSIHPLQAAYEALFAASQAFFLLPVAEKKRWKHKLGTEEGWSSIPGEKEFITLRSLEYCPDILREPAKRYWDLMGAHLSNTLGRVSASLGLPEGQEDGLRQFIGPCCTLQATDAAKTATMLRLFRYESWEPKVVAEPHADLGLLSVVVGNVPGLEVWNGHDWFDVERVVERAGMKGASMLVGRQLERLSNGRYGAGGHRVVSYGLPEAESRTPAAELAAREGDEQKVTSSEEEKRYRFSIVFVLRAHESIIINSDALETDITGKWEQPMRGVSAGKFYDKIKGAHYNINIGHEEREQQRKNVERRKGKSGENGANEANERRESKVDASG